MTNFIQTKEDGTQFVYATDRRSAFRFPIERMTATQIKTKTHTFRKSDGMEIGGGYYKMNLITKEKFIERYQQDQDETIRNYTLQNINLQARIDELNRQMAVNNDQIAEYKIKRENPPV